MEECDECGKKTYTTRVTEFNLCKTCQNTYQFAKCNTEECNNLISLNGYSYTYEPEDMICYKCKKMYCPYCLKFNSFDKYCKNCKLDNYNNIILNDYY